VGRLLPLPQPLAVGPNRPPRRAKFTHSKFKRADDLDNPTPRQKRILDIEIHSGELASASFFRHSIPQSEEERQRYLRVLLTWDWGLANTSRVLACHCCTLFYAAGFILLLMPALYTFVEVTRYTINHLFPKTLG
jgi:hypothetical protein